MPSAFVVLGVLAAALLQLFVLPVPALRSTHGVKPLIQYGRRYSADTDNLFVFNGVGISSAAYVFPA